MIRFLIASSMVLIAGNANAIINEDLYSYCNSLSNSNFKPVNNDHLACITYFAGVAELADTLCAIEKYGGINYDPKNMNASIQHYVNEMKNKPEEWKYTASLSVWVSLVLINGTDCPPKE